MIVIKNFNRIKYTKIGFSNYREINAIILFDEPNSNDINLIQFEKYRKNHFSSSKVIFFYNIFTLNKIIQDAKKFGYHLRFTENNDVDRAIISIVKEVNIHTFIRIGSCKYIFNSIILVSGDGDFYQDLRDLKKRNLDISILIGYNIKKLSTSYLQEFRILLLNPSDINEMQKFYLIKKYLEKRRKKYIKIHKSPIKKLIIYDVNLNFKNELIRFLDETLMNYNWTYYKQSKKLEINFGLY
ncbi:MAG: hypothetical protein ACTSPY_04060 [Candidatus Helarchaeota archaeon]